MSEIRSFNFSDDECPNKLPDDWWEQVPPSLRSGTLSPLNEYDKFCDNCREDSVLVVSGGIRMGTIPIGQIFSITYYCPVCKTAFMTGRARKDAGSTVVLLDIRTRQVAKAEGQVIKPRVRKER